MFTVSYPSSDFPLGSGYTVKSKVVASIDKRKQLEILK